MIYTLSKVTKNGKQIQDKDTFALWPLYSTTIYGKLIQQRENIAFDGGPPVTNGKMPGQHMFQNGNATHAEPEDCALGWER